MEYIDGIAKRIQDMKKKYTARAAVKIFRETLAEMGVTNENVGIGWRDEEGNSREVVILGKEDAQEKTGSKNCLGYVSIEGSILFSAIGWFGAERTKNGDYVVDILHRKFDEYDARYEIKNACELTIWR